MVKLYDRSNVIGAFSALNSISIGYENNNPRTIQFIDNGNTISFQLFNLQEIIGSTITTTYSPIQTTDTSSDYANRVFDIFNFLSDQVFQGFSPGPTYVGGVVAAYPNFASFPVTGTESVIYIDEADNSAYYWDGSSYQLLVSTGVEQYANFASFPITGSANVIYVDMANLKPYVWDGSAYESIGGDVVWGGITGTLSAQTDLQAALDAKFDDPTGTTSEYIRGDGTLATFPAITAGTVTSVGTTGLISGGPITGSGTITTSMATNKLVGRYSASTGIMEEISVGSGLTLTGAGILNNTATPTPSGYYGAWQSDVTQTAAASNTGYAMILGTIDLENQVRVVTDGTNLTRITFDNTGIYNLQFSSQFQNTNSTEGDVTIWLRLNGVDVPGSSGFVSIPAKHGSVNGHTITSWNYLLSVVAGQYYELVWSTTSHTNVTMRYYAAGSPPPSTASVIATVTQQAGIMAGTGVTAINSLTGAAQTLATGTSGTDFAISSTGTTHTFDLPTASAANTGKLSSTDWSTFNGKENAANKQNSLAVDGTGVKFPTVDAVNNLSIIDKYKRGIQYFTDFEGTASVTPYFASFSVGGSVNRLVILVPNATNNQIGIAQYQTGTTATGYFTHISEGFFGRQFFFGGGSWVFETFLCVETLSTSLERFRFVSGFGDQATNTSEGNGVFFTYDEGGIQNGTIASPNWQCVTSVASVRTLTTTTTSVTAGAWTRLRIEVNAAGTSVSFFINGTLAATHTTNIPTWISPSNTRGFNVKQSILKSIGTTNRSVFCDYLGYENRLTTPR
jgi:hypothetical protein